MTAYAAGLPRRRQPAGRRRDHRLARTSGSARCGRPSTLAAADGRGRLRAGADLQPRGRRRCSTPGPATGASVAGQIVDGARRRQRRPDAARLRRSGRRRDGRQRGRDLGLDLAAVNGPLLAPGLGAQGGTAADLRGGLRRRAAATCCPPAAARSSRPDRTPAALRGRAPRRTGRRTLGDRRVWHCTARAASR